MEALRRWPIAHGAGVEPQAVSGLVKQFVHMRPLMKAMVGQGVDGRMKMVSQMGMMDGALPKLKKGTTKCNPQRDKKRKRRRRR